MGSKVEQMVAVGSPECRVVAGTVVQMGEGRTEAASRAVEERVWDSLAEEGGASASLPGPLAERTGVGSREVELTAVARQAVETRAEGSRVAGWSGAATSEAARWVAAKSVVVRQVGGCWEVEPQAGAKLVDLMGLSTEETAEAAREEEVGMVEEEKEVEGATEGETEAAREGEEEAVAVVEIARVAEEAEATQSAVEVAAEEGVAALQDA